MIDMSFADYEQTIARLTAERDALARRVEALEAEAARQR